MAWRASSTNSAVKGQIFLDPQNPIIEECLRPRLFDGLRRPCELQLSDFDDINYKVVVKREAPGILYLSIYSKSWEYIRVNGGEEMLHSYYPGMTQIQPESGFSFTLAVNLDEPPYQVEQFFKRVIELKRNMIGAPFAKALGHLQNGSAGSLSMMRVPWRSSEDVFILPQVDRVTVIFGIDFVEADERALCKVFLMEFADAQRSANNAPPTNFSLDPPMELQNLRVRGNPIGYLSFIMFPQHVKGEMLERSVSLLAGFRNYLHYHIKSTKTYMHMRMRKRATGLLQVLNRAVPEVEDKAKKTAQGKTFVRS
mmetsp:Transcript_4153/g.6336  ORF Transcript_4153/g.6336 Transcript_4153/m.6336 type:complete len:311 (+) Transcript_4153:34-966(+)|eukprot:CAMPEP_0171457572 /NCGR_PEP_ID=MMETSP0945-20130129/3602_1 /TAXON_ID=109269 /ORGANISM="Vaucheria litorea, Strain CCMP2940" /LENGTH=310 /DNA_ID=CAMNT_0011983217 /DNA_START=32 /DNA_END=964 /DNA_ORIENTATION=-